jgi:hypothetical protein
VNEDDDEAPAKPVAAWVNSAEMSQTKFVALTSGIIICGVIIAMLIDELETGMFRFIADMSGF